MKMSIIQKHAPNFTLTFLLSQLLKMGFALDRMKFESVASTCSVNTLIDSVKYDEAHDQVVIFLNVGWKASQSILHGLPGILESLEDSELFDDVIRKYLYSTVFLLHPELDVSGYGKLYYGALNVQSVSAFSSAQLNHQFRALFPAYDISVSLQKLEKSINQKVSILGQASIGQNMIGHYREKKPQISLCLHEESLSSGQVKSILLAITKRWVKVYGRYWGGFILKVLQECQQNPSMSHLNKARVSKSLIQNKIIILSTINL